MKNDSTINIEPKSCWALRKGELHIVFDSSETFICEHVHANEGTSGRYCCAPLKAQGTIIGLLFVEFLEKKEKDPNHLVNFKRLITHFSDSVGLIFANIRLREDLRLQAIHDPLTGLFNRRYLTESFNRAMALSIRKSLSLSVLMVDIDKFKYFNDNYGHEAGDLILKAIGEFIQKNVREYNIACRFGGEEFLIVLLDIQREDSHKRAESIRAGVEKLEIFYYDVKLPQITVSIGVASFPENAQDTQSLIALADKALYQAKEAGRNRVVIAEG